jgi:hypothetical protein
MVMQDSEGGDSIYKTCIVTLQGMASHGRKQQGSAIKKRARLQLRKATSEMSGSVVANQKDDKG